MVAIVEADPEELRDPADRRPEPRDPFNLRQRFRVDRLETIQAFRPEHVAPDVVDHAGQIADLSVAVQKSRLFLPVCAKPYQLHCLPPAMFCCMMHTGAGAATGRHRIRLLLQAYFRAVSYTHLRA